MISNRTNVFSFYQHWISIANINHLSIDRKCTFLVNVLLKWVGLFSLTKNSFLQKMVVDGSFFLVIVSPVIIICSYLTKGQKKRLTHYYKNTSYSVYSSYWLYSCIDNEKYLSNDPCSPFDSLLFSPPPGYVSLMCI